MRDPNKEDKRKQDLMMKKVKRSPASEGEKALEMRKARKDAIVKMRDKGMGDIIKSLSESAVRAEKSGDDKEAERLMNKIDKLKSQLSDEQDSSAFKDGGVKNPPKNKELYSRVKAEAKKKFKGDWPSAYGSAWLVREYKKRGGKY
jgi:hypothetical protein